MIIIIYNTQKRGKNKLIINTQKRGKNDRRNKRKYNNR